METPMNLWHVGCLPSPKAVDGVNVTVWLVAREQAALGHHVSLLVDIPPVESAVELATQLGIQLIYIPTKGLGFNTKKLQHLFQTSPPDLVHMHSVFLLRQATLARQLIAAKIPYIITPHGGLDSQRGQLKKKVYNFLIERRRFAKAGAITVVAPREAETVHAFVPHYQKIVRWVANPFNADGLTDIDWQGNVTAKKVVFLGRFDVLHKGLDFLINMASHLPDVEFHLYGNEDQKTKQWLSQLQQNCTANVHFHQPVYGAEKFQVLVNASLYIQTSRWEGFPVSIVEAMHLGLPCAISERPNFATLFREQDLGLVLSQDVAIAATQLSEALNQPERLRNWSERARVFAYQHFQPRTVAKNYLDLYEEVISQ
jgi:glycosyltransferase involved in cell wall biosynthesis